MTELGLEVDLVPETYTAWSAWDRGNRLEALERLERLLLRRLDSPVLGNWDPLLKSEIVDRFPAALQRILSQPLRLHVEPARVATVLWQQAPCTEVLTAIALGDFRWSDDPFEEDPEQTPAADALAALLRKHLAVGMISRDPTDLPYGGRPVMSQELLAVTDAQKLGPVADTLATVPAGDPDSWWNIAPSVAPTVVVRTFARDAFGDGARDPVTVWSLIQSQYPAYARAVRASVDSVVDSVSVDEWHAAGVVLARSDFADFRSMLRELVSTD